ncbi:hypothetical protein Sjap_014799 [Stephania japonica]|uniref:Uncharacterized protein n=1 Tax=Stephania japonica TaxID=461633 RepID=A0AAP0NQA4_9MAGN
MASSSATAGARAPRWVPMRGAVLKGILRLAARALCCGCRSSAAVVPSRVG